jgi:hypothetical protein
MAYVHPTVGRNGADGLNASQACGIGKSHFGNEHGTKNVYPSLPLGWFTCAQEGVWWRIQSFLLRVSPGSRTQEAVMFLNTN